MALQFALHMVLMLWPSHHPLASAQAHGPIAQPGCNPTCGNVDIRYPFGMNDPKCYANKWFQVECRHNSGSEKPYLKLIQLEVIEIDESLGKVWIKNPIYRWNCKNKSRDSRGAIDMGGSPFAYSQDNGFLVVGCNKQALLLSSDGSEVGGCVSICDKDHEAMNELRIYGCHGKYCCTTSLPLYLSEYKAIIKDTGNKSTSDDCDYALIAERGWLQGNNNGERRVGELKDLSCVPAVLEWEIVNPSLQQFEYTNCYDTNITSSGRAHAGRRCQCSPPFTGNPYVAGGCIDSIGYSRPESQGMPASPGYSRPKSEGMSVIGVVFSSLVSIVFVVGVWIQYKIFRKSRIHKRKEKYFKQHGGLLLQRRSLNGGVNFDKTKLFSSKDLEKATDRFNVNRVLGKGGQGTVYKGMLADGKIVAVKKLKIQGNVEEFINEVVILSQINHRSVVKLLGFCLETQVPLLVYEFIPNGNLFEHLHEQNEELSMTWEMRLRIASEVAGALFYLHSAASRPVYHRDIKSTNILLDEKFRAKVADFGTSRMVSIENTHLTTLVHGTFGYLDPEYFLTSQFTEKSDVYSFGVVLVELLTGQEPISFRRPEEARSLASYFIMCMQEDRLYDILDRRIMEVKNEGITAVANLAKRCLSLNGRKRPTMREVTMELEGIQKLGKKSNIAQKNYEDIDFVGFEVASLELQIIHQLDQL